MSKFPTLKDLKAKIPSGGLLNPNLRKLKVPSYLEKAKSLSVGKLFKRRR